MSMQIRISDEGVEVLNEETGTARSITLETIVTEDSGLALMAMAALIQVAEMNARLGTVGPAEEGGQRMTGIQGAVHATQQLTQVLVAAQVKTSAWQEKMLEETVKTREALESIATRTGGATSEEAMKEAMKTAQTLVASAMSAHQAQR